MMLVRDAWLALADDERTRSLVEPFALLAELPEAEHLTPPPDIDEMRRGYALDIPATLPALRKLAQIRAMTGSAPPRRAAKAGRNDPCPCGSGKKYKRCCGLN